MVNTQSNDPNSRHCAFCLKVSRGFIKCTGCDKRAYCSKACQTQDWSISGPGQRHKNWCNLHEHGEEDVDWEVVPIKNKGLGIVAKKFLPAGYKIIVEPVFTNPYAHPGIKDLEPKGASLEDKFELSQIEGGAALPFVALRTARLNHNCQPNVGVVYDETAAVNVVFAQRDINPGEEICTTYSSFGSLIESNGPIIANHQDALELEQFNLLAKFGFVCPDGCLCKDSKIRDLVLEVNQLNRKMNELAYSNYQVEEALEVGEKVLEIYKKLNISWFTESLIHRDLFDIGVLSSKTLPKALNHLESRLKICRKIAPYSAVKTLKLEELLKNPSKHQNYLKLDKGKPKIRQDPPLKDDGKSYRHCAFCLNLCGIPAKLCGGCKKRSYCSKDCQSKDWSPKGSGQGHKNWCGFKDTCGEEDLDWEVVAIPNKGLGVRAKKLLPAGFRIIVEHAFTGPMDHPGIKDLEPKKGSIFEKFHLNCFGLSERESFLGLRSSRVNHSCKPNSGRSLDETAKAVILVAQQVIQPGEEITVLYSHFGSYQPFPIIRSKNEIQLYNSVVRSKYDEIIEGYDLAESEFYFAEIQFAMRGNWGFVCPSDCFCKDIRARKLIVDGKRLYKEIFLMASKGRIEEALKAGEKLLEIDMELNILPWAQRAVINFNLFEIALPVSKLRAQKYLEKSLELDKIVAPFCQQTGVCEKLLKELDEIDRDYSKKEKMDIVVKKYSSLIPK